MKKPQKQGSPNHPSQRYFPAKLQPHEN